MLVVSLVTRGRTLEEAYDLIPYNAMDDTFIYAYDPDANLCSGDLVVRLLLD